MVVIGGMGSVSGSVLGAIFVIGLAEALRRAEDATQLFGMSQIVLAVIFLLVIIFRRDGLLGQREIPLDRLFMRGGEAPSNVERQGHKVKIEDRG
jgi:branched-chain amino acid transport system permease protein